MAWPRKAITGGSLRSLLAPATLADAAGEQFTSACQACPDEPCIRFDSEALGRPARMDSPYSPDHSVCPTAAIKRGADGLAAIDASNCIGCGLCVVRCPVGAIWLDEDSATARVQSPSSEAYERRSAPLDEFIAQRAAVAAHLGAEAPPFGSPGLLGRQMDRVSPVVAGPSGQNVLRLLARNAFLVGGASARLKIVGDNSAACELLVDDGAYLLVVEVEPSVDALDAMRRVLAGTAVLIARYGARLEDVTATLIINRLPNKRVDYYGVATDIQARLGLTTITIPTAVLLLWIRAGGVDLEKLTDDLRCLGDADGVAALFARFGPVDHLIEAGLIPAK